MSLKAEVEGLELRTDLWGPDLIVFSEDQGWGRFQQLCPNLWNAIQAQAKVLGAPPVRVLISRVAPHDLVKPHKDGGPHYQRWHLPITAPSHWWDELTDDWQEFPVGEWSGPVPFWVQHSVRNEADVPRIVAIVDFNLLVPDDEV